MQDTEKVHAPIAGTGAPTLKQKPESLTAGSEPPFQFDLPPSTTRMVNLKSRKQRYAQAMKHPATQKDSQATCIRQYCQNHVAVSVSS